MNIIFKLIAAFGLLLISYGILCKDSQRRNILFAIGGIGLLMYSIYLHDPIFIPLQIIFTGSSLYELYKIKAK